MLRSPYILCSWALLEVLTTIPPCCAGSQSVPALAPIVPSKPMEIDCTKIEFGLEIASKNQVGNMSFDGHRIESERELLTIAKNAMKPMLSRNFISLSANTDCVSYSIVLMILSRVCFKVWNFNWLLPDRLECTDWIQINLWWTYCLKKPLIYPILCTRKLIKIVILTQRIFLLKPKISLNCDVENCVAILLFFFYPLLRCSTSILVLILHMLKFNENFVFSFLLGIKKKRNKVYIYYVYLGYKMRKTKFVIKVEA